jgi:HAD superfamily hydrolase (TIGR01509 family)
VKAVFFDLDGTLLDSNYLHVVAWRRALLEAGHDVPSSLIHHHIGMGGSEMLETLIGRSDDAISSAHGCHFDRLKDLITALPGASELVLAVKERGALVVVVTSAVPGVVPDLLGALGVENAIDLVVHGEDAQNAKPDPDLFEMALARSGVGPRSVLAVGDTVWDVQAAGRAGIGCVCVTSGGTPEPDLRAAGALAVYETSADVLARWRQTPFAEFLD